MAVAFRSLLLPALAFLIGALALGQSALIYDESRTVEQHGVRAPIQAIANSKKIKRSGDRITFAADITFTGQDGRAITSRGAISDQTLDAFKAGQPVEVRYLPDHPDTIRVVGDEHEGSSVLLLIIGLAGLAYGSFAAFRATRRTR